MSKIKKIAKIIRKIILGILGLMMFVELFSIPGTLIFNHYYPNIIDIKFLLIWLTFSLVITWLIGLTFYELTHSKKEKDENKNRR